MSVKPIPEGYHSVTPYLIVKGAAEALEFYGETFGATVKEKLESAEGHIQHAEIIIGDSVVMLSDECPELGFTSPESAGGTSMSVVLYLPDVDAVFGRALAAGATELRPLQDQFYGDRMGTIRDPFGHVWSLATHIEDVSPEEIQRRLAKLAEGGES